MSRSLLVTGAAGFIGANFVHYWRARHPGDRVVVSATDDLSDARELTITTHGPSSHQWDSCSMVIVTSALLRAGRDCVPEKITSSIADARMDL